MEYRRLGRSGLQVSVLSFGSWVTFGNQLDTGLARDCLTAARDARRQLLRQRRGVRRRRVRADHGPGHRRARLGAAVLRHLDEALLGHPRRHGQHDANTLNRKYLMQAIDGSLERLGLDFVDLLFCHRPDPNTPIEETVWAMSDIISAGQGPLLGHLGVGGRRDPGRVGDRRPAQPAQAGGGAAAVQPVRAPAGREGVRPAVRGHRPRPHDVEPAGVGPAERQVPRRHPRGEPGRAAGLRVAARTGSPTPSATRSVQGAGRRRRPARLHALAAGDRVVRRQPPRLDGHHRRQPRRAGARRTSAPSTCSPSSPPTSSPRSTTSSADRSSVSA